MTTAELVAEFLAWTARNRKPATVSHYRSRLRWLVEAFGSTPFAQLTPLGVETAIHAAGVGRSPDTRRANVVAFNTLQSWAVRQRLLAESVVTTLEKPAGRIRQQTFSQGQVKRLLRVSDPAFSLIFRALLRTGARPGELAGARIADWYHSPNGGGYLRLDDHKTRRKTGQPRKIPLGAKASRILSSAAGDRSDGPIFLNGRGKPWTASTLSRRFRRLWEAAGLPVDAGYCLYCTRHTHGTCITRRHGIFAASKSLGHANVATTSRHYANTDDDYVRRLQDGIS